VFSDMFMGTNGKYGAYPVSFICNCMHCWFSADVHFYLHIYIFSPFCYSNTLFFIVSR
jgi:hypothetical protein